MENKVNKFTAKKDAWFIIKDEESGEKIHHGKLKPNECIATINKIETYSTELEWKNALDVLGFKID